MPAQLLPQHALYRYIFGELNATKCNYHGTLFSVHALDNLTLLEPDVPLTHEALCTFHASRRAC